MTSPIHADCSPRPDDMQPLVALCFVCHTDHPSGAYQTPAKLPEFPVRFSATLELEEIVRQITVFVGLMPFFYPAKIRDIQHISEFN